LPALLRAALELPAAPRRRRGFGRGLILSGVDEAVLAAAPGVVRVANTEPAPFVDLAALRASGRGYLDALSQNTRYQLRRSARRYAEAGPLCVERAKTVAEAWDFLDALATLHQETWTARGRPGAFADPFFRHFHRDLLAATVPQGRADVLRIAAGSAVLGYLYNFRNGGRVLQYQGGFAYGAAAAHQKPGLTCHHLAIEHYLADGAAVYDFLAGDDRYKSSLATERGKLFWLECAPPLSPRGVLNRLRRKV
jgi:CelD/BcsL family acetyltransferase involved in cellulose biosynthesis